MQISDGAETEYQVLLFGPTASADVSIDDGQRSVLLSGQECAVDIGAIYTTEVANQPYVGELVVEDEHGSTVTLPVPPAPAEGQGSGVGVRVGR